MLLEVIHLEVVLYREMLVEVCLEQRVQQILVHLHLEAQMLLFHLQQVIKIKISQRLLLHYLGKQLQIKVQSLLELPLVHHSLVAKKLIQVLSHLLYLEEMRKIHLNKIFSVPQHQQLLYQNLQIKIKIKHQLIPILMLLQQLDNLLHYLSQLRMVVLRRVLPYLVHKVTVLLELHLQVLALVLVVLDYLHLRIKLKILHKLKNQKKKNKIKFKQILILQQQI